MTQGIQPSDFDEFFWALHGIEAFPWQKHLARQVCEMGTVPETIGLPTGTGKTSLIEIALFHLAYDLANSKRRSAPLRIVWVVDRRLVVDDVYARAKGIKAALERAEAGALKAVADALSRLSRDGPPLVAQQMRGGMPLESDWARTPTQPTVISSTVDQIGSRLLFRGYGVSPRMRPIHAGLLGEDALLFLDEVHLAEPFRQTLQGIERQKGACHGPWRIVQLSATPRVNSTDAFGLSQEDEANPMLAARLARPKPAALVEVGRVPYGSDRHAEAFAEEALRRIDLNCPKNILVVVNRVGLARRIYDIISSHSTFKVRLPEEHRSNITLLIGRNREVMKDRIGKRILARCKSDPGGAGNRESGPFVAIATQCIEAGADLDFDVLITQIAPLDSLRQRFGRLNRMGRPIEPEAAILAIDAEVATSAKADPIYQDALRETWRWLKSKVDEGGTIDFASSSLNVPADESEQLNGPTPDAPVLMPEHVRALSRTNPAPPWSPDPALYLHGTVDISPEVNVVWRADLPEEAEAVANLLSLVPPRTAEAVSMPIGVVRKWLRGDRDNGVLSDVGIIETSDQDAGRRDVRAPLKAWRWRASDRKVDEPNASAPLRPGDTIIVSSAAGGCDEFGWNPDCRYTSDIGDDVACAYQSRYYPVRLHRNLFAQAFDVLSGVTVESAWGSIARAIDDCEDDGRRQAPRLVEKLLDADEALGFVFPPALRASLDAILKRSKSAPSLEFAYTPVGKDDSGNDGVVIVARRGLSGPDESTVYEPATESDELAALGPYADGESLQGHSNNAQNLARAFGERLELPRPLVEDIALAAYLHDLGKADLRFQRYLAGSPWQVNDLIRAKSGQRRSRAKDSSAWRSSGLPEKWRHEGLSVRIAREHPSFAGAHDAELVLWLIGTHHGFGRPTFPHSEPRDDEAGSYYGFEPNDTRETAMHLRPSAGPQRVDFEQPIVGESGPSSVDWQTMFRRLEDRYGVWGLAWLESIVRLADHRASEKPVAVRPEKSEEVRA